MFDAIFDLEYVLTPIAHEIRLMSNRPGVRRHYIHIFGLRVISWVTYAE